MTLELITESHGEIDTGFYSAFTQFIRLGTYSFATRHFCELLGFLAENPKIKKSQLIGYDLDLFWERQNEDLGNLFKIIMESEQSFIPELQKWNNQILDKKLEELQDYLCVEDDIDLYNLGKMVPVIISNDEKLVSIGEYRISTPHFGSMARYIINGGWMGWVNGVTPDFARSAGNAINNSERDLYKEIRSIIQ